MNCAVRARYDNLFSWLVDTINTKLTAQEEVEGWRSVSVLDIFGFENFKLNGFEQMFINTANEKLQVHIPSYVRLLPLVWLFPLRMGSMGAAWR